SQRTNIYYLQTTDFGETWTTIEGQELETPVTDFNTPSLVMDYKSEGKSVYIKDVDFDENGNPILLYLTAHGPAPGPETGLREWYVVYWDGKKWVNNKITNSAHNYDSGSLFVKKKKWTVIAPFIDSPQNWGAGGELVRYESLDKGK